MEENEVMEPQYGFWETVVEVSQEDSETGKVKKVKEVHLIDGVSVTDIEKKVAEEMKGTMWDWKIVSCKQSRIGMVY